MNLKQRIIRQIEATGPISVADYMAMCLFDRDAGYYTTREPFGKDGDFITAPEVSQIFGELIGVWCVSAWQALGAPSEFVLCEMGPGRGTLMKDLIRTAIKLAPDFMTAAKIHMVEISDRLTQIQQSALGKHSNAIVWTKQLRQIGPGPLVLDRKRAIRRHSFAPICQDKGPFCRTHACTRCQKESCLCCGIWRDRPGSASASCYISRQRAVSSK